MRISDWSSDVCSSDLGLQGVDLGKNIRRQALYAMEVLSHGHFRGSCGRRRPPAPAPCSEPGPSFPGRFRRAGCPLRRKRSEEHTSELQSLMRISYAVFCLKKKKSISKAAMKNHYEDLHITP